MIKYRYNNTTPNKEEKEEIKFYLENAKFIETLMITKRYYIQGYHGDYEFLLDVRDGIKYIVINIF